MRGPSLLSMMTGGLFGGAFGAKQPPRKEEARVEAMHIEKQRGMKRIRKDDSLSPTGPAVAAYGYECTASRTPTLIRDGEQTRSAKRLRASLPSSLRPSFKGRQADPQANCDLLMQVPEEVVGHLMGFLNTTQDRFALQCTCADFRRLSNNDDMLVNVALGGDLETGERGLLHDDDTPATASAKLRPFARAKNKEATYMLGMIKSYCYQDVDKGIFLLKLAKSLGYVRSSYALGLILRDTSPQQSAYHFNEAASKGYLPALQEILPAREMKARFGEPTAKELRRHLDPVALNRLLGRHYLVSSHLRDLNTSHCWNPLCGRWAFKATTVRGHTTNMNPMITVVTSDSSRAPQAHHHHGPPLPHAPPSSPPRRQDRSGRHSAHAHAANVLDARVSRMKMCSRCCRAKYCSKLCQVYDWRSGRHKMECQFL